MTVTDYPWIEDGQGLEFPSVEWTFLTRSTLISMAYAMESREVFAVDLAGILYRLDSRGERTQHARGFKKASHLAWSASGDMGVLCESGFVVVLLDREFEVEWEAKFREDVRAVSISSDGNYIAVALTDSQTIIFDRYKKKIGRAHSKRPLDDIHFAWEEDSIIGSSDRGLLCSFSLKGNFNWSNPVSSRTGQSAINRNGGRIYLSTQDAGILVFDGEGVDLGSYQTKGVPKRLAISPFGERMAVLTAEGYLLWMDLEGTILWATMVPEQIVSIACDSFGTRLFLGQEEGEIICLRWSDAS